MKPIRILTYKRTHTGDLDRLGRFGIGDCMGRIRSLHFNAVIGVGGTGLEPQLAGIARKLTWIGIGPRRTIWDAGRAELVEFEHFLLLDTGGPDLMTVAPHLATLLYGRHRRFVLNAYPSAAYAEALQLLDMARQDAVAGQTVRSHRSARRCRPPKDRYCPKPSVMKCPRLTA